MLKACLPRALALALCAIATAASPALAAETAAPGWRVVSRAQGPSNIPPGGDSFIDIRIYNDGAAPSNGTITVTDVLPRGLTYTGTQPVYPDREALEPWTCSGTGVVVCRSGTAIAGSQPVELDIKVHAEPGISGALSNHVTISGGGAAEVAAAADPLAVSNATPQFGVQNFEVWASNANGTTDTQAGSHPYELTTAFDLNTLAESETGDEGFTPAGEIQNLVVDLPTGIVGDPNAVAECPRSIFDEESCPASTQVGVDTADIGGLGDVRFSVFNMVPPPGVPAQLGFELSGLRTYLDTAVRSGGDFGINVSSDHIVQKEITFSAVTIWGVPSDPSHNAERCAPTVPHGSIVCGQASDDQIANTAYLTMPNSCGLPVKSSITANSWEEAATFSTVAAEFEDNGGVPVGFEGCEHLSISPTMTVAPDTKDADTPAGLTVDLEVPQEGLLAGAGLATADIEDTEVTLPEGIVINPGQAAGLEACQADEDGLTTEAEKQEGKENDGPPSCPNASKVGTVTIQSPLIENAAEKQFEGNVYVLQSNPPELKLLVAASADGVNLKLVGTVHLNEQTGQLVTTFDGTPQLPFTDFKLSFSGGAQAALATPTECGVYQSSADFTPWTSPFSPDAFFEDSFAIASGTDGSPCASPLPFTPSMIAGATTDQAGGYTDFSMLLRREDDQQRISSLQFKTPEGLLGMLSKVPLCQEPQAAQGTCSAASQIGHTIVASGPGPYPLVVPEPGQPPAPIYLTGPYEGAPFGLSIVVPVVAGPFNLGTVVVRASIAVDPHTAQLTITTDPLPRVLDGVPTDLRVVNAVIDRPGFMFNPTSCDAQSFSGSATSVEGTVAPLSSHFQMGSCRSLTFKPNFKVSTQGKTSRANGASLTAKIVYPTGPLGANQASQQSNIASVKVELPKKLPSRLTTLQKACTAAVFEANPANCPAASLVGRASAVTPVLPVTLNGPVYFVSHGGEAFPSLIVVLQGYGVTVDLVGSTFISKAGITSSTFKSVPDVPITEFELVLPEGPYSALAANGDLCKGALAMPTQFVGQNGAEIHQSTKIAVTGCPKAKRAAKKSKKAAKHAKKPKQAGKHKRPVGKQSKGAGGQGGARGKGRS
jgi:hypothetical protein